MTNLNIGTVTPSMIVDSFALASASGETRASLIRAAVEQSGNEAGDRVEVLEKAISQMFAAAKLVEVEKINVFNATMRRAIVSALSDELLTCKLSVKADKLFAGRAVVVVTLVEQVEKKDSPFTARKGLEQIQSVVARLALLQNLDGEEKAALLKIANDVLAAAEKMDSRL